MCGIFGSFSNYLNDNQIKFILNDLKNRGPDAEGIYQNKNLNLTMLHTRLKIVDLNDRSNQPFIVNKRYICVYNGEIYNLTSLKKELIKKGFNFTTTGDTEVLIKAYIHWGEDFLDYIDGMFAFIIFDLKTNNIIFSRDKLGQKPLYYAFFKGHLLVSSKLTLIIKLNLLDNQLNLDYLPNFLINGFVEAPNTILKDIFKLIPGEIIKYNLVTKKITKTNKLKIKKFQEICKPDSYYLDILETKLEKVISNMHPQEVPSAYLLSGGLDSSILIGLASRRYDKINTFTITQQNSKLDESSYAKLISQHFNTNHFEVEINDINPLNYIDKIYDEPIIESSLIPSKVIFQNLPKDIKVTIGGDGADELFGGYNHYTRIQKLNQKYYQFKIILDLLPLEILEKFFKNNIKVSKWINALNDLKKGYCPSIQKYLTNWQYNQLLNNSQNIHFEKGKIYSKENVLQKDIEGYLANDILLKLDHSSMFSSKEARSPYLSNDIYHFAKYICPSNLKFDINERKIILKKLGKRILPQYFQFERKQGFQIDVKKIVYSNEFEEIFNEIASKKNNFFDIDFMRKLYYSKYKINSEFIFNFCCFQRWLSNYKISV